MYNFVFDFLIIANLLRTKRASNRWYLLFAYVVYRFYLSLIKTWIKYDAQTHKKARESKSRDVRLC